MTDFANNPFGGAPPGGGGGPKTVMGAFVIPADPDWEPMEFGDYLEKEGYFALDITGEKQVEDGVWLTLTVVDEDFAGKRIQTKLDDPNQDPRKLWKWRALIMSIVGNKDAGKGQFGYQPGIFKGRRCYGKTQTYAASKTGEPRTGVNEMIIKSDYDAHVAANRHRWPANIKAAAPAMPGPGAFALPAGLPPGVPGAPPAVASVPQPPAAAPVQTAPPAAPPPQAFSFGGPPQAPPAVQPPAITQPAAVPQPTTANPFAFPGQK